MPYEAEAWEQKECPYCGELILARAKKCKHCGEILEPVLRAAEEAKRAAERPQSAGGAAASSSASATVVVQSERRFPHGVHLVLTLLTCGFWLPIWLIHYLLHRMLP